MDAAETLPEGRGSQGARNGGWGLVACEVKLKETSGPRVGAFF